MMMLPVPLREAGVTAREAEVLRALGARLTNAEIAENLHISVRTVESHVSALLRKLAAVDRLALAALAPVMLDTSPAPLPATLADAASGGPFVGRVGELDRLQRLGERVRRARVRRWALIIGEAGIGKTRLAAEVAMRLHASGAIVAHGRCQPDTVVPYQALLEALRPLPGRPPDASRPVAGDDPSAARYRLFEEYDRLLASPSTLVVLILDDVQWLDPPGAQVLSHVLRHADRSPLLLLATGRPELATPRHPLTAVLGSAAPGYPPDVVHLSGLALDAARELASAIAPVDAPHVRSAWERTGGNPFLFVELLRHQPTDGSLPASARDAVVRRVAGLGPSVHDVLVAAAAVGEPFHLDLVIGALGGDPQACSAALDRAFAAALIVRDGAENASYRFAHAIVREALLAVASPSHSAGLHLRLASVLESTRPLAVSDIARHRHAALPAGQPDLAYQAALTAYNHAMNRLAYGVAASFAGMALAAIAAAGGGDHDHADALLRRGRARVRAGDLDTGTADCRAALDLANRLSLPGIRVEAILGWADASPVWGRSPELCAALEQALADDLDLSARAQVKARLAQALYYEDASERRRELCRQATDDARRSGRADILASVLATTHAALWEPVETDHRTALARQIVTVATTTGQNELEVVGLAWLATDLIEAGDLPGADRALVRHAELATRLGQRLARRDAESWSAMRAILDGRFADAADHVERAHELSLAARDPSAETIYWVQRYWLAVERGDTGEMHEVVEPCERIASANPDVPAWRAALAMLHARRGDHGAARTYYEPFAAAEFRSIPHDVVWLNAVTYLAETCALLRDEPRAPTLLQTLAPYADRVAVIDRALACKGSVRRFLGLLAATTGDRSGAEQHLDLALRRHVAMRANPLVDRTRREIATVRSAPPSSQAP
jgi:DNA-binding CsgD family transcriptional regulator